MVKIRLMRVGKRKQPSFRVVVADSRSPRDGRIIETIGHYHPREDPSVIEINGARAVHWLQLGAQPSNTVKNLLRITGAWSEFSGEAPPPPYGEVPAKKTTPVKATPAASVSAEGAAAETEEEPEADATPEGPESPEEVDAEETPAEETPAEETAEMPSIDEDVAETTEDDEAK